MNENQTLEMQIHAKSQEALQSLDKLISKMTGVEKVVNNVSNTLNKGAVTKTTTNINQLSSSTDKATNSANKLTKALSLGGAYIGVKRLTSQFLQWMDTSIDFTEQLNLFNVVFKNIEKNGETAFSNIGKKATQFQYKLNEAFGTNKTQTLYMQGIFQSMGENVGIQDTYSAIMSETMTKMTYDLASLYNKSENTVAEAIRAGVFAGQTKPLRSFGIDVTQMSMQPVLDSLGITERSVKQMSQAEKEILRYIATLNQAKVAMGDFANTVESPANQLKIFKQQLVEVKVAVTSLFMGTFASILPYANAFLMVVKEISKAIATMFGIELKDYNTGIASQEGMYDGLSDSVDNAIDKVKELKRQTLGFDQTHNIDENKDSGSGSGSSGAIGGIDQRLLDAIKGYDNGMESVRMKAIDIRDRIMEWLGFTRKINPLTGETYFEFQGVEKVISNIVNWWKNLNTEGKIWTSLGVTLGFTKLFGIMKKISELTGLTGLFKNLISVCSNFKNLGLVKSLTNLVEYTKIYTSLANGNLLKGIKGGTSAWLKQNSILTKSNAIIAMVVVSWTSFIKQYNNNAKFKKSIDEIFNSIKALGKIVPDLISPLSGYIKKAFSSITTIIDSTVNSFVNSVSLPFKMINNIIRLDFKSCLADGADYFKTFGENIKNSGIALLNVLPFVNIKTEAEKFAESMKKVEKEIFNNGGVSIKEYKKSLDELLSSIVNGVPNVSKYSDTIKDSKASYDGAKDSLGLLLTQMQTDAYEVTADDISKLNTIVDTMAESVKLSGQAFTDATTSIVNHLVTEGKMANEQALNVVKAAQMKAEAENDRVEQYRLKMIELNDLKSKGLITDEEYAKKQLELADSFTQTTGVIDKTKQSMANYIDYINGDNLISTKSWKELSTTIGEIGTSYKNNKKELEENYKSQKTILEQLQVYWGKEVENQKAVVESTKNTFGANSVEYQNAKTVLEEYKTKYSDVSTAIKEDNKQRKDDIKDMQKVTAEALLGIVKSLKDSSYPMKEDAEGIVKALNKQFKSIGLDVDLTKNMEEITKKVDKKLGTDTSNTVNSTNTKLKGIGNGVNPVVKVKADTSEADRGIRSWAKGISGVINTTLSFLGLKKEAGGSYYGGSWHSISQRANGGIYSNGSWENIKQYANGGAPSHGSLFWAGENGAEVVAHANGRTEVLNQSQIASAIYSAVASAMSQYGGQSSEIEVHVHTDEGTVIDRIEQRTKQTGKFPWTIPTL